MINIIRYIMFLIFIHYVNLIYCFKNNGTLNTLQSFQIENEVNYDIGDAKIFDNNKNIDGIEIFDDDKNVDDVKKMIYPKILSYNDLSINLDEKKENFGREHFKLNCSEKYSQQFNNAHLKILKILLIMRDKKLDVTKHFNGLCRNTNSCSLTVQLSENNNFVDNDNIVHLKMIDDDKRRAVGVDANSELYRLHVFLVCEDAVHPYKIPTKSRHTIRHVFSHGQIAYLRCVNHKTVRVIKITGKNSSGINNSISKEKINSYCSEREICKVNMLDIYDKNELNDYVFYEVKYACRVPKVCFLCRKNSTCELEKLFSRKKEEIAFESNGEDDENGIFRRLLPGNEDEEREEPVKNIEYNAISIDLNNMVSLGNNSYHIYEICKCKTGFRQEGLVCFKNGGNEDIRGEKVIENEDTKVHEQLDIINPNVNIKSKNEKQIVGNNNINITKSEEKENNNGIKINNKINNDNVNNVNNVDNVDNEDNEDNEDLLNEEKGNRKRNMEESQRNDKGIIKNDDITNVNDYEEDILNLNNKYKEKDIIEENYINGSDRNNINSNREIENKNETINKKNKATKKKLNNNSLSVINFLHFTFSLFFSILAFLIF